MNTTSKNCKYIFKFTKINLFLLLILIQLSLFIIVCVKIKSLLFLRQFLGFIYLTFVPGYLILNFFKLDDLDFTETVVYTVSLSLSYLMILGLIINNVYPLLGISKPFSEQILTTTLIIMTLTMTFLFLKCGQDTIVVINFSNKHLKYLNYILLLSLLPLLSILGSYIFCYYNINYLLLILLFIISIIPIFAIVNKLPENIYPAVIWVISISLLFHQSLSTAYLGNWGDNQLEYFVSKWVEINKYWGTNDFDLRKYGLLSLVVINPFFSIICDLEMTWVFKILRPIQFSITPLILYLIYKYLNFTNKQIFLSVILFMFFHPFYKTLSVNIRTSTAILFLSILILTLIIPNRKINEFKKYILFNIFSFSIVVSHYGISYIIMFLLILTFLFKLVLSRLFKYKNNISSKLYIKFDFVMLFVLIAFSWYMYTAKSSTFNTFINFILYVQERLLLIFSHESYPIHVLSLNLPPSALIYTRLLLFITIFITVGVFYVFIKPQQEHIINLEYRILSFAAWVILLSAVLPIRKYFNPERIYPTLLVFLSPFCIIGFSKIIYIINKIIKLKISKIKLKYINSKIIFSIFLSIFLLFGSGFVSEVFIKDKDYSVSTLIHKPRQFTINDPNFIFGFYSQYYTIYEILGGKWLTANIVEGYKIYVDGHRWAARPLWGYGMILKDINKYKFVYLNPNMQEISEHSFVYLRYYNYYRGIMIEKQYPIIITYHISRISSVLYSINKIYVNSGISIYSN